MSHSELSTSAGVVSCSAEWAWGVVGHIHSSATVAQLLLLLLLLLLFL